MSRWEIISKSISRHTVIESLPLIVISECKTARGITEGVDMQVTAPQRLI